MRVFSGAAVILALIATGPVQSQEQGTTQSQGTSWWGLDVNSLAGAASALGLFGAPETKVDTAAGAAGQAPTGGATGADWTASALNALGSVDWTKAASTLGITGFGAGQGAAPTDGSVAPAGYLQQLVQGLLGATPEQQAAFFNGVTAELPRLANEVTTWWNGLPQLQKDEYLGQIKQMIAYLASLTGIGGTAQPSQ